MIDLNTIYNEDCLEGMKRIPDKSVDMILCDLPYGTTEFAWDCIIPIEPLWMQYMRVIKESGAIVLTANQPFTSALVMSNPRLFRYEMIWDKIISCGMVYARFQPMRQHESVLIFGSGRLTYNPQKTKRDKPIKSGGQNSLHSQNKRMDKVKISGFSKTYDEKNPTTILPFMKLRKGAIHPTQKPVALFEYLIKTYTNEGETVLDNCIGSGTTAIACMNTNRNFIGFEKEEKYWKIATERVKNHTPQLQMAI